MNEPNNSNELEKIRELVLEDKLGLDALPELSVKKRIQEGFVFNVLLVGETGIGKSTLASSLFNIAPCAPTENHNNPEVVLKSATYEILEQSVKMRLTVIETEGYGDQINREDNVVPIIQYIDSQFEMHLKNELDMKRSTSRYKDARVHVCLYFICPTGHNLKSLDVFCMKQLHRKVNLLPIIAKSDCLSADELKKFKMAIRAEIEKQAINIYHFPTGDENMGGFNSKSNNLIPFAAASSKDYASIRGKLTCARIYPWGTLLVENDAHSEFLALKHALIEVNMEDMEERTDEFYESYRTTYLIQLGREVSEKEPITTLELFENMRKKLHKEMKEEEEALKKKFAARVRAKDKEFKAMEEAMYSKYNALLQQAEKEQIDLDRQKNKLELEMTAFKSKVGRRRRRK